MEAASIVVGVTLQGLAPLHSKFTACGLGSSAQDEQPNFGPVASWARV